MVGLIIRSMGLPGARWIMKNTIKLTPNKMGIMISILRSI
jgi:hypothetical protein